MAADRPCPDRDGRPDQRVRFKRTCRYQRRRFHRHRSYEGGEVRRVHPQQRRQRIPRPELVGPVRLRDPESKLAAGPEQRGVAARDRRMQDPGATDVHAHKLHSHAAVGAPEVRSVRARQRCVRLPGPHRDWAAHRRVARFEHSGVSSHDPQVHPSESGGGPVKRSTRVLTAAALLAAIAAAGGLALTSGTKPATAVTQPAPANTAQVQKRTLSATVPQDGTLTYRARSDGSPYSVINQARGTYTALATLGQVIHQGGVLYRVNDRPVVLLYGSTPAY